MDPQTFDAAVTAVLAELRDLIISKQRDYGQGNVLAFGELGLLVRQSDKLERLKNLYGIPALLSGQPAPSTPENEPVDDTWRDMLGYAALALMLRRGWFTLPLEPVRG